MVCKTLAVLYFEYASVDCVICLWKFSGEGEKVSVSKTAFASSSSGAVNQESWSVTKTLR